MCVYVCVWGGGGVGGGGGGGGGEGMLHSPTFFKDSLEYMQKIVENSKTKYCCGSIELHVPSSIHCFYLSGLRTLLYYKQMLISSK